MYEEGKINSDHSSDPKRFTQSETLICRKQGDTNL